MKSITFLLLGVFLFSSTMIAQNLNPCGTEMGRSDWLKKFQAGDISVKRSANNWLIVPIHVHITGEDDGSGYTSAQLVGESIKIMNEAFAQVEMQFFLSDDYHYINNSTYHNHAEFRDGRPMMQNNNVFGAINIYICEDAAGNCGYFSPSRDAIVINNDCLDPVNQTLAHEMGHFLSLPHPFSGWEGTDYDDSQPTPEFIYGSEVEKVDGSNCEDAGDGFCGTAPDYLSYRWPCNEDGESALEQFDPDGVPFRSQGDLIMGYSTGDCRTKFSDDQIDAMAANVMNFRSELLEHNREFQELTKCGRIELNSPVHLETVQYDDLTLYWENIPGIDFYHLRVSKNINFTDLVIDEQMSDTSFAVPTLDINRLYFWQVDGFAAQSPCVNISTKRWLNTSDLSETVNINSDAQMSAYMLNEDLLIKSKGVDLKDARISLFDMSGREVVLTRNFGSENERTYSLSHLVTGVYLVRVLAPNYEATLRIFK